MMNKAVFESGLKEKINALVSYFVEKGCKKLILFGSIAEKNYTDNSDIDIAVSGLTPADFFTAIAVLPSKINHTVDKIDIEDAPEFIKQNIEKNGIVLYAN